MGNVLRALKKAISEDHDSADEPIIQVVTDAVADAEKASRETLDRDADAAVVLRDLIQGTAKPAEVEEASTAEPAASPDDDRAKTPTAVQTVPRVYSPLLVVHHRPRCQAVEQIRQLRTSLLNLPEATPLHVMVTSAEPREGKSITSSNLAICLSEIGDRHTLLIDGDMRHGCVGELFGLDKANGLAELLDGKTSPAEAITRTDRPNLDVVTCGVISPERIGPAMSGANAAKIFRDLVRGYDHVVIDAPPALGLADAGIIGRWVRTVLLAVRMKRTARGLVEQTAKTLGSAGIKIAGLVALDDSTHGRGYYCHYGYGYYA